MDRYLVKIWEDVKQFDRSFRATRFLDEEMDMDQLYAYLKYNPSVIAYKLYKAHGEPHRVR